MRLVPSIVAASWVAAVACGGTTASTAGDAGATDGGKTARKTCTQASECGAGHVCLDGFCLGQSGASCTSPEECLSGQCIGPTDCHSSDCVSQKGTCSDSIEGAACVVATDCASGQCEHTSDAALAGSCCGTKGRQCTSDSECCPGLNCHTDNSGCGEGPTPVCTIDGVTYKSGDVNPKNECQHCDTFSSLTAWTDDGSYARCHGGADGYYCCHGACSNGTCP